MKREKVEGYQSKKVHWVQDGSQDLSFPREREEEERGKVCETRRRNIVRLKPRQNHLILSYHSHGNMENKTILSYHSLGEMGNKTVLSYHLV